MGLIVGDEASRLITRAKSALVLGYDLYASGQLERARAKFNEAADCSRNATTWVCAEQQMKAGDWGGARATLDGLIELDK